MAGNYPPKNSTENNNPWTKEAEDMQKKWDQLGVADPDEYWENIKKYNDDELEKLNGDKTQASPADSDPNQAALDRARAYNEAHADEMYKNWREGQGLDDVHTPGRIEGMYSNPDGEYYKGDGRTPGRIEGMYSNPNGDYYKGDETEARWKAWYENRGEPLDDSNGADKDPDDKGNKLDILTVVGDKNPDPNGAEGQPKTQEELQKEKEEIEERIKAIEDEQAELAASGLIAVNVDVSRDRDAEATNQANRAFKAKIGKSGTFKKIWMNYFEKYYKTKYKKEILEGGVDIDGEHFGIEDIIEGNTGAGINRVVRSVAENEMDYIHNAAGEKLTKADEATTEAVRKAIMEYANARGDNADQKLFTAKLKEQIAKLKQEGNFDNPDFANNYFQVAENAIKIKELMRGEAAMEKVLEKFAVYNATINESNRTVADRDVWDRAIDKWENSKLSRIISPETVAVATSVVSLLAKSGASMAAKIALPVGGILVSGGLAGVRERRRVTNDREDMMRNLENGAEYNDDPAKAETRAARKRAKYEAKIAGTTYDIKPAKELTSDLIKALESNDEGKIVEAYAAARVRTDFSDSERKGLISYSAESKRGGERLALDSAMIEAKRRINTPDNKAKIEELSKAVLSKISEDVSENDADFKRVRAGLAAKKALKTVVIGAATFVISQEAIAALSDKQVGILEKLHVLKTQNQVGARETMLASMVKSNDPTVIKGIAADNEAEIRTLEQKGYKGTKVADETTTTRTTYVEGDPADSAQKAKVYVSEWANNGTEAYDGNELRAVIDDNRNLITTMQGDSYAPISGRTLNFENLVQENKLRGFATINGHRFEALGTKLANGQVEFIHNGMIRTPGGAMIEAIDKTGKKLYEFFEIGGIFGKDPTTKLRELVPMATDVGVTEGAAFTGMFQEPVTEVVSTPAIYDFSLPTPEVTYGGVILPDLSAREGIGNGTPRQETSSQGGGGETAPNPPAAPAGEDEPDTDDGEPGDGNNEPDTGDGEPGTGDGEPDDNDNEPGTTGGVARDPGTNQPPTQPATQPANQPPAQPATQPANQPANQQPTQPATQPAPAPGNQPNNAGNGQSGEGGESLADQQREVYRGAVEGLQRINSLRAETADFLLETPDEAPRTDEEYKNLYDNLTDKEKEIVLDLYSRYATFSPDIQEGRGFMDWLRRRNELGAALGSQQNN